MYASFRSVTDKNSKILTPTRTGNFLLTLMDREFYTTDSLVKCICWKKQSTKEHTNNPAVSALPWSGTLSWDDDIIPSEWSAWNLVKGFDCFSIFFFFFFFFFFCPSATWLLPSHLSLFSIFRHGLLRTFLCIKEENVRGIHTGRNWKEEELHFISSFLPIVAFLDRFIVSSEPDGASPRYHQRLQDANTETRHFWRAYYRQV